MKSLICSKIILIGITLITLQGCAHTLVEKRIDEKLTQEKGFNTSNDLKLEATLLIEKAPGLNSKQKENLRELRDSMSAQMESLRIESLKLRALLIQDTLASADNSDEVALVKERLKNIENKRLSFVFDAVEQANSILGRQAPENQNLMYEMLDIHAGQSI